MNGYKTYIGILVALIPTVANLLGYDVSDSFSGEFEKSAEDVVTIVGLVLAFYGRAVATAPGWFAKR